MFGAKAVGQATSFAPDYGKALTAAGRIFALLDRPSEIDTYADVGAKPVSSWLYIPTDCEKLVISSGKQQ